MTEDFEIYLASEDDHLVVYLDDESDGVVISDDSFFFLPETNYLQ